METDHGHFIIFSRPNPPKVRINQEDQSNATHCIQKRNEFHLEFSCPTQKK